MKKFWFLGLMLIVAESAAAQGVDISTLDKEVRSSGSKSIMFQRSPEAAARAAEARRQEEAEQKRQAQQEKARQQQKKAAQQSKLKKEQAVFRPYNLFGSGFKIAAVINGEMISNKDLQERANLFSLTTGILAGDKNKKMVQDKVLQNTVDEKIKLQEAEKMGIKVSDAEIKEAYRNFEKSNGVPAGAFAKVLQEYHISNSVFMTQIRANLAWKKLLSKRQGINTDVSAREVKEEYERIKKDMNTPKYMVSEIVIKKKDAEHIDELVNILQKDPRFELYAAQFSQSASAPSGGRLGWVTAGQLATPLDQTIRALKEGQVSKAVPYRADYYIFKMGKIYNPQADAQKMPDEDEVRAFIKNRKADEMANKYIRDLRNRAVVEQRF
jgi:parvulin-like peptidyl-prolyl isomerase